MTKSIEEQAVEYTKEITLGCCTPKDAKYSEHEYSVCQCELTDSFLAGAKARDEQFLAVVNELREALKHTNEFCLCKRNTYGFDYHEDHPVMGKPKSGSRWLTPRDYNKDALTKADQLLKEMGIV